MVTLLVTSSSLQMDRSETDWRAFPDLQAHHPFHHPFRHPFRHPLVHLACPIHGHLHELHQCLITIEGCSPIPPPMPPRLGKSLRDPRDDLEPAEPVDLAPIDPPESSGGETPGAPEIDDNPPACQRIGLFRQPGLRRAPYRTDCPI